MRSVLVAGAGGLIGSRLADRLRALGDDVHALVRRPLPGLGTAAVDLTASEWESLLPARADVVVHLAQSSRFRDWPAAAPDVFGVNVLSVVRLMTWSARCGAHFVLASTGGVYEPASRPLTERDPVRDPVGNGYVASKLAAELAARAFDPLRIAVVRPFFVYGRGQGRDMFLPRLYDTIVQGRPVSAPGGKGLRVNPVHVDDAVDAIAGIIDREHSGVVNIAGPDVVDIASIAALIARHLGVVPQLDPTGDAPADLIGDTALMASISGPPRRHLSDHIGELAP